MRAFALQIVCTPQHHRNGFGQLPAVRHMPREQLVGLRAALDASECAWNAEWVKPMNIAASWQDFRIFEDVAARRWLHIATVQCVHQCAKFVVGVDFGFDDGAVDIG